MSKKDRNDGQRKMPLVATLMASAVQMLAPNGLQFNDQEFQRSPKEAQQVAREAAKLVRPGDLIFITTSGFLYSMGRYVTNNDYDHVAVVLDEANVLHVGMPTAKLMPLERLLLPQRQPVVLRIPMTEQELQKFLRCARQLIGCTYDIVRAYHLVLRLMLKHITGSTPLRKLPINTNSNSWICSDSIIVLLAGCSHKFREALVKAKKEEELDLFTFGSASLSDFTRIRRVEPSIFARVQLPVVDYTLIPHRKPWRAYVSEFVQFLAKIQSGKMRWPTLHETVFPELQVFARTIPPKHWPVKAKAQVIGYTMILLVVLKRGWTVQKIIVKTIQLLFLRYLAQQLLQYMDVERMKRANLAKL